MIKRISFLIKRRAEPAAGRMRLWECIDLHFTGGDTRDNATELADEIKETLLAHYDADTVDTELHE